MDKGTLTTGRDCWAMPDKLSAKGVKAWGAIVALAKKHELSDGGCRVFYSPKEWAARGERYGCKSKLVVVYDGGEFGDICKFDGPFYEELLASPMMKGLFIEECTGWYSAVYPC